MSSSNDTFLRKSHKRNVFNKFYCKKYVEYLDGCRVVGSKDLFLITKDNFLAVELDLDTMGKFLHQRESSYQTWLNDTDSEPPIFERPLLVDHQLFDEYGFKDFAAFYIGIDRFVIPVCKFDDFVFDNLADQMTWGKSYFALVVNEPDFKNALVQMKLIFG